MADMPSPRCLFAIRYPAGGGTWWYRRVLIADPAGQGYLVTAWPPSPGDLITLWDQDLERRGLPQPDGGPCFRVVERCWGHPGWGSATWPYGAAAPSDGPLADIIVEPAAGPYRDEAALCAETTCEAVWMHGAWQMPPGAGDPVSHQHRKT